MSNDNVNEKLISDPPNDPNESPELVQATHAFQQQLIPPKAIRTSALHKHKVSPTMNLRGYQFAQHDSWVSADPVLSYSSKRIKPGEGYKLVTPNNCKRSGDSPFMDFTSTSTSPGKFKNHSNHGIKNSHEVRQVDKAEEVLQDNPNNQPRNYVTEIINTETDEHNQETVQSGNVLDPTGKSTQSSSSFVSNSVQLQQSKFPISWNTVDESPKEVSVSDNSCKNDPKPTSVRIQPTNIKINELFGNNSPRHVLYYLGQPIFTRYSLSFMLKVWKVDATETEFLKKAKDLNVPFDQVRALVSYLAGVKAPTDDFRILSVLPKVACQLVGTLNSFLIAVTIAAECNLYEFLTLRKAWLLFSKDDEEIWNIMLEHLYYFKPGTVQINQLPSSVISQLECNFEICGESQKDSGVRSRLCRFMAILYSKFMLLGENSFWFSFSCDWSLNILHNNHPQTFQFLLLRERDEGLHTVDTISLLINGEVTKLKLHPQVLELYSNLKEFSINVIDCSLSDRKVILNHLYFNTSVAELVGFISNNQVKIMIALGIKTVTQILQEENFREKIIKELGLKNFIRALVESDLLDIVKSVTSNLPWDSKVHYLTWIFADMSVTDFKKILEHGLVDDAGSTYYLTLLWCFGKCNQPCEDIYHPKFYDDVHKMFRSFASLMPDASDKMLVSDIVLGMYALKTDFK